MLESSVSSDHGAFRTSCDITEQDSDAIGLERIAGRPSSRDRNRRGNLPLNFGFSGFRPQE